MKRTRDSYIFKLLLITVFIFYIIPLLATLFIRDYLDYLYVTFSFVGIIIIPLYYLFFYFFNKAIPFLRFNNYLCTKIGLFLSSKLINLSLAFIFLVLNILFIVDGHDLSFRQSEQISDFGVSIKMLFFLKYYFLTFISIQFLIGFYKKFDKLKHFQITYLFLLSSFLISLTSSTDVIYIIILLVLLFDKRSYFVVKSKSSIFSLFSYLYPLLAIFLVVSIGFINKIGVESFNLLLRDSYQLFQFLITPVLARISTWNISFLVSSGNYFNSVSQQSAFYSEFSQSFVYFRKLFGESGIERGEVWSINRFNYLQIFNDTTLQRAGTSPGHLASIFYFPIPILGFFLILIYDIFVTRLLTFFLFINGNSFNFFLWLILLFIYMPFIESPFEVVNFLNPVLFHHILFFFGMNFYINKFKIYEIKN